METRMLELLRTTDSYPGRGKHESPQRTLSVLPIETSEVHRPDAITDHDLVAGMARGDDASLGKLLDRYWQPLVSLATEKLGCQELAEDLTQEVFIRIWEHRGRLGGCSSPRAYLYRVLRNLMTDEFRKRAVRRRWKRLKEQEPLLTTAPGSAQVEADNLKGAADRAIAALPERRRDVFLLAHFHGLSYREVAVALEITPRTVANHMHLALKDLRHALRDYI